MVSALFHALVYDPIYNGLVFFVDVLPSHDMGVAVVIVTIVVRIILFPLSRIAIQTQMKMKEVAPDVETIKKKYQKPEEQGRAILDLYREKRVRPFAGFLLLLVQLPILIGLYWVFAQGGLPDVDTDILYALVPVPGTVDMEFLGFINMSEPSFALALLAGVVQFIYTRLSMGPRGQLTATEASLSKDMARTFDLQARYMLPTLIGVIGFFIASAAPLYWLTGNLFMIGQELLSGRRFNGPAK